MGLLSPLLSGNDDAGVPDEQIDAGESNFDRRFSTSAGVAMTSGYLRGGFFTATRSETITKVAIWSGNTAAGATPTLVRVGIWEATRAGAVGNLVASIANDTSLLAATNTEYERALSAAWSKVAGTRYFAGLLVVTSAAAPTTTGTGVSVQNGIPANAPRLAGVATGQTDLVSNPSTGSSTVAPYIEMRR